MYGQEIIIIIHIVCVVFGRHGSALRLLIIIILSLTLLNVSYCTGTFML